METEKPYCFVKWEEPLDHYTLLLQKFVISTGLIETGTFLNRITTDQIYNAVPGLETLLCRHGLNDLYGAAVIRALPFNKALNYPHTDTPNLANQCVALNWPVFNCEKTYTAFYKLKEGAVPEPLELRNGSRYTRYQYDMVEETHRIKLDKPAALRVDVLHSVINTTDDIRITISFRFKTNHWELFNG